MSERACTSQVMRIVAQPLRPLTLGVVYPGFPPCDPCCFLGLGAVLHEQTGYSGSASKGEGFAPSYTLSEDSHRDSWGNGAAESGSAVGVQAVPPGSSSL